MDTTSALRTLSNLGYLPVDHGLDLESVGVGVKEFQIVYRLTDKSGYLSDETLKALEKPRCGFPDRDILTVRASRERRVAPLRGMFSFRFERRASDPVTLDPKPWPNVVKPFKLFYEFGLGLGDARQAAVLRAMAKWSGVDNGSIVTFEPANGARAHFKVSWVGDGTMEANYLADSCLPLDCSLPTPVRFNGANPWSAALDPDGSSFSVESIALHEIGHVLGLVHPKKNDSSIMSPDLSKGETPALTNKDRDALRHLYHA